MAETPVRLVAFGGGTGLPVLLKGLKSAPFDITVVVVISDDGGSSGELRTLYDMPAPGDLRNVIMTLSEADPDLVSLLQYRFDDPLLGGHSLGNLVLAALTRLEGGFEKAISTLCRLARVKAKVIPMAVDKLSLVATHTDGTKSTGEVKVSGSNRPIEHIQLMPQPKTASPECLTAISQADVIVLGPGSLFTSVIPHFLIPGVVEAMSQSRAKIVYVANIMTQPGETTGFDLQDHINALTAHGCPRVDAVLCHDGQVSEPLRKKYEKSGASLVLPQSLPAGTELWTASLLEEGDVLRHSSQKVADSLLQHLQGVRA